MNKHHIKTICELCYHYFGCWKEGKELEKCEDFKPKPYKRKKIYGGY